MPAFERGVVRETKRRKLKLNDARRVSHPRCARPHFYARAIREVYVKMPAEDPRFDPEEPTALLLQSLYGTQEAGANWEVAYSKALEDMGFSRGSG